MTYLHALPALVAVLIGWKFIQTHERYAPKGLLRLCVAAVATGAVGWVLWPLVAAWCLWKASQWAWKRRETAGMFRQWEEDLRSREGELSKAKEPSKWDRQILSRRERHFKENAIEVW